MKRTANVILLIALMNSFLAFASSDIIQDASYIKKTVYRSKDINDNCHSVSYIYRDGLGNTIQKQSRINNNPSSYLVLGTYKDQMGRDSVLTLPFVQETNGSFMPTLNGNVISGANSYFDGSTPYTPNAGGRAYQEKDYWNDGTVKSIGKPSLEYSLSGANFIKNWLIPVNLSGDEFSDGGFLKEEYLNEDFIGRVHYPEKVDHFVDDIELLADYEIEPTDGSKIISLKDNTLWEYYYDDDSESLLSTSRTINTSSEFFYRPVELEEFTKFEKVHYVSGASSWERISFVSGPSHMLKVVKDENGSFFQSIIDKFGNAIKSCVFKNNQAVIDSSKYDLTGKVIEVFPPDIGENGYTPDDYKTFKSYTSIGQVLSETRPDNGTTEFRYNSEGKLKFKKTSRNRYYEGLDSKNEYFTIYEYDRLGRHIQTNVSAIAYSGGAKAFDNPDRSYLNSGVKLESVYDTITLEKLEQLFPSLKTVDVTNNKLAYLHSEINNTDGRHVADIAYNDNGDVVIDINSYEKNGRFNARYKIITGLPIQKDCYEYDFNGNVVKHFHYSGMTISSGAHCWNVTFKKEYNYDVNGKLTSIDIDGKRILGYGYTENGIRDKKYLYGKESGKVIETVDYVGDIFGKPISISTGLNNSLFSQSIYYHVNEEDGFADGEYKTLHNGAISGITYSGYKDDEGTTSYDYNLTYNYDELGRLTNVIQDDGSVKNKQFDESFQYDNMGRITEKIEGVNTLAGYSYTPGTNKLAYISTSTNKGQYEDPENASVLSDNYLYDLEGNLVLDRSKNMVIEYDWRNQPTTFKFYNEIPVYNATGEKIVWSDLKNIEANSSGDIMEIAQVVMVYDASGKRVKKLVYQVGEGE